MRKLQKSLFFNFSRYFVCFKGLSRAKMIFSLFQTDLKMCRKHFRGRWERSERSTIDSFLVISRKRQKNSFLSVFQGSFVFQRLVYSLNDFSLVPKRPKKMQKTFSRKMGPTRTFYDRWFLSYLKKTSKTHFWPFSEVFCVSKANV